jgi:hypothetical protein
MTNAASRPPGLGICGSNRTAFPDRAIDKARRDVSRSELSMPFRRFDQRLEIISMLMDPAFHRSSLMQRHQLSCSTIRAADRDTSARHYENAIA